MSNFYANSINASNSTSPISVLVPYTVLSVNDGQNLLGTLHTETPVDPTAAGRVTFTITGTDHSFVSLEYDATKTYVRLFVNDGVGQNALWKNKSSYDFYLVVGNGSTTTTLQIQAQVNGSTAFNVTSSATIQIANNARGALNNSVTTDIAPTSGLTLSYAISGTDASKFTVDATTGILSLNEFADSAAQSSYSLDLTVSTDHTAWVGLALTVLQVLSVTVSAGKPVFVSSQSMSSATLVTSYTFTSIADGFFGVVGSVFASNASKYRLGGVDSAAFTINPDVSQVDHTTSKTAVISLTNAASYQVKSSYSFTVEASNSDGVFSLLAIPVSLAVSADTTFPVFNLFDSIYVNDITLGATLKIASLNSATQTLALGTMTTSEPCTFALSGANADLIAIVNQSTTLVTSVELRFSGVNAPYHVHQNITYTFTLTATDAASNATIQNFQIVVSDTGAPFAIISSPYISSGTSNYTSLRDIPFQFLVSPTTETYTIASTDPLILADIVVTNGSITSITRDATNPKLYTGTITPTIANIVGSAALQVSIDIAANLFTDDAGNFNVASTTFIFMFDMNNGLLTFTSAYNTFALAGIPVGRVYTPSTADVTSTDTQSIITFSPASIAPIVAGEHYVTYTSTDSAGNARTIVSALQATTTHANARVSATITVSGGTAYWERGTVVLDDATVTINNPSTPGDTVTTTISGPTSLSVIDNTVLGTFTLTYRYTDAVFGAVASASRSFIIEGVPVVFTLGNMNGALTTSSFIFSTIEPVTELDMSAYHVISVSMLKSHWNDLFYIAPEAPGLAQMPTLANIDVFEEETILYKTNSTNMQDAIPNLSTNTLALAANTLTSDTIPVPISNSCTKIWSKRIFQGQEHMENVFSNTSAVVGEINSYLTETSGSTFLASLRTALDAADNLTNASADRTTSNLTRQLMMQLHAGIFTSAASQYRLTNSSGGIFAGSPVQFPGATEKYYAFRFIHGDKLNIALHVSHPAITPSSILPAGSNPPAVDIRVEITMVDA